MRRRTTSRFPVQSSSKQTSVRNTAKIFQFCFKLYKLPSLGWPPKEAAGSLENGRSREEEEEGKQGDGGHRTEDADDLEICCSKVQPQQRAADGFCAYYAPPEPRFCTPHHIAAAKNLLSFRRATRNSRPRFCIPSPVYIAYLTYIKVSH